MEDNSNISSASANTLVSFLVQIVPVKHSSIIVISADLKVDYAVIRVTFEWWFWKITDGNEINITYYFNIIIFFLTLIHK